MPFTLLLGGARSGKSALAVEIGTRSAHPVTYIATAPVTDEDMTQRITRHRAERPAGWATLEAPADLTGAVHAAGAGLVIIDCLTLWTSNMMLDGHDDDEIHDRAERVAVALAARSDPSVVISNEVGLGVHPASELGRRYRDVLGRVNQRWARAAETTLLLVAGRAIRLDDAWDHLAHLDRTP